MTEPNGQNELRAELDALRQDIAKVQGDLRSIAQTMVDTGRQRARETGDRINERVETTLDSVQECIEQRPMATVAITFAVGMLLGRIMSRD